MVTTSANILVKLKTFSCIYFPSIQIYIQYKKCDKTFKAQKYMKINKT
jgi:hypothetical protein